MNDLFFRETLQRLSDRGVKAFFEMRRDFGGTVRPTFIAFDSETDSSHLIPVDSFINGMPAASPEDLADYVHEMLEIRRDEYMDMYDCADWEVAKEHLEVRLCNKDRQELHVAECPTIDFLDLCVYPVLCYSKRGTSLVSKRLMKVWGVSLKEVFEQAMSNMEKKRTKLLTFSDIIGCLENAGESSIDHKIPEETIEEANIVMAAYEDGSADGANILMDRKVLGDFHRIRGNFYIIPSGTRECVFIPIGKKIIERNELINLRKMLKDVNKEDEDKDDLSGNLYFFDGTTLKIA